MEVCVFGGRCAARIDHDQPGAAFLAGREDALIEHRVAPGEIAANQNDEVGLFEVVITARHSVSAKGALVTDDGGRHAQTRIGIDIGRADEAFHQLVGDVIVLGEELARHIHGHTVRTVSVYSVAKAIGDQVQGTVPARAFSVDLRVEQTFLMRQGLAEG